MPRSESTPTSAKTPMKPITKPKSRFECHTVVSPDAEASKVAQIGTVAISNPANPDEMLFSAVVIKYQGPTISRMA